MKMKKNPRSLLWRAMSIMKSDGKKRVPNIKVVRKRSAFGFTLLEILIALFIFSILSLMMVGGLRSVINAQSGGEDKAERLRNLQMVILIMSRDIEQAINRPELNAAGQEEAAFLGTPQMMTFTHVGFANPTGAVARSTLQRTGYSFNEDTLIRL